MNQTEDMRQYFEPDGSPRRKQSCVQNLCDELAESRASNVALRGHCQDWQEKCDRLERELAAAKADNKILENNYAVSAAEAQELRTQVLAELRRVSEQKDSVYLERDAARAELAEANRYISELEDRMDSAGLASARAAFESDRKQ